MRLSKIINPRIARFPTHLLLLRGFKRLSDFFLCKQKSQEPVLTQERAEPSLCQSCRAPGTGVLEGQGPNRRNWDLFPHFLPGERERLTAGSGLQNPSQGNRFQLGSVLQLKFSPRQAEVSGIVLLAVGVWGRVSLAVYFSLLDEKATNVPFVLVGAGTVVVLLGTFGCFATCRGSTWMLKLYAMLLSLIFLIVLVAAVVGFVFRHEIKTNFESNLNLALRDYNVTKDRHSEAVDTIQRTLHCCGVQNYSDWERTEYFTQRGIPQSCCKSQDDCSEEDLKDPSKAKLKVFVDGCFFLVTSTMESKMSVVAGISFGVACFQLVGIILACCLSQYITNNQYEMV